MISNGQTIHNPVTGERLTFLETARQTGGESVRFEAVIAPGGTLASAHQHPNQTERFEITSGTLTMWVGRRKIETKPGDVLVIEPGTPHNFRNKTGADARMTVEIRPALSIEPLLETMFGLAADGKTNRWGMPNPFRLAVIARKNFDTVQLPLVPVWMQRAALAVADPVGRALGFTSTYEPRGTAAGTPSRTPQLA